MGTEAESSLSSLREPFDEEELASVFRDVFSRSPQLTANELALISERLARMAPSFDLTTALRETRTVAHEIGKSNPVPLSDYEVLVAASFSSQGVAAIRNALESASDAVANRLDRARLYAMTYPAGRTFLAAVIRVSPRHALVQTPEGDTAILAAAHFAGGKATRSRLDLRDVLAPGETVHVEVVDSDGQERRIEVRPAKFGTDRSDHKEIGS
jgi:hypothetical protein